MAAKESGKKTFAIQVAPEHVRSELNREPISSFKDIVQMLLINGLAREESTQSRTH